jgi:hypothetical protein
MVWITLCLALLLTTLIKPLKTNNMETQYHIFHSTGPDAFEEVEKQPRQYAGFVTANSLEEAFFLSNNDNSDWAMNGVRSTSVGDVIQQDDKFFMVCGTGFKELVEEEEDLATKADQQEEAKYYQ